MNAGLLTNAKTISQSSAPNFNFDILLAITRSTTAMVASTDRIVAAATISGPRFSLSQGTALAQIRCVDEKDSRGTRSQRVLIENHGASHVLRESRVFGLHHGLPREKKVEAIHE